MYKKKELQLSCFSICEGKKLDDKIVTYFALKAGSTVYSTKSLFPVFEEVSRLLRYHSNFGGAHIYKYIYISYIDNIYIKTSTLIT